MQQTLRPYVTAGIAIVGSGLIAATPVATPSAGAPTVRDVALTAGDSLADLTAPWTAVYNEAATNATQLVNNFFLAPGVGLQQMMVNQSNFWHEILNDPAKIPAVMQQMQANLDAVLTGFTLINASGSVGLGSSTGVLGEVTYHTLSGTDSSTTPVTFGHDLLMAMVPSLLPADMKSFALPLVDFAASPLSGIIMGELGPMISPLVAMMNSIHDGDGLNTILANTVGGYLNGATLNLDSLLPLVDKLGLFPAGTLSHLNIAFGGLLTGGDVAVGPYETADSSGHVVDSVPAVGGSILNSLGLGVDAQAVLGLPLQITIDGHGIGPIGAWEAWSQTVGALLGSGWTGKGSVVVTPPGAGLDFPTIPDNFFDDGGAGSGAADFMTGLDGLLGI